MSENKYLLVLGVGNLLLTDEGVGVKAVEALAAEEWPIGVDFLEAGTATQDISHLLQGYAQLLVLDVVHAGGAPGDIYLLDEDDLVKNEDQRLSLHDIDLLDSLGMAEMMYGTRATMRIVGIEPKTITDWSMELTPELQEAFPRFLAVARKEILRILDGRNS